MIYQQKGRHQASTQILNQGLDHFAASMDLKICQGINYMNQGHFQKALQYFTDYTEQAQVHAYIDQCRTGMEARMKSAPSS